MLRTIASVLFLFLLFFVCASLMSVKIKCLFFNFSVCLSVLLTVKSVKHDLYMCCLAFIKAPPEQPVCVQTCLLWVICLPSVPFFYMFHSLTLVGKQCCSITYSLKIYMFRSLTLVDKHCCSITYSSKMYMFHSLTLVDKHCCSITYSSEIYMFHSLTLVDKHCCMLFLTLVDKQCCTHSSKICVSCLYMCFVFGLILQIWLKWGFKLHKSFWACFCLWQSDFPEIILYGWQDVKIQLFTHLLHWWTLWFNASWDKWVLWKWGTCIQCITHQHQNGSALL